MIGEAPLASAPTLSTAQDAPAVEHTTALLLAREDRDAARAERDRWHRKWRDAHEGAERIEAELRASLQSERLARETAEQELRRVIVECNQTDPAQAEALWPSAAEIVRAKMLELDMLLDARETADRVHLRRHTRLAEALGMDPGYSVDATIDKAIEVIRAAPSKRACPTCDKPIPSLAPGTCRCDPRTGPFARAYDLGFDEGSRAALTSQVKPT